MNVEQQVQANAFWVAVLNVDIQLFKASYFKLRWGSPGGIDQALPAYDEALRALRGTPWAPELAEEAADLARRVESFKRTLEARDSTIASAEHTRMLQAFEELRDSVRYWPEPKPTVQRGSEGARDFSVLHGGMERS